MQNTNSGALIRLQPLQSNGIGDLIEEQIRYTRKVKGEEEAQKQAEEARKQAFRNQRAKDQAKSLAGIKLEDSSSYFRDQVVKDFEANRPRLSALKLRADDGDFEAGIQYNAEVEKYRTLTNLDKNSGEAIKALLESQDDFNEFLDGDKQAFAQNIISSNYRIKDGKVEVLSEDGKNLDIFSVQELQNRLNSLGTFSGKANFDETGDAIADSIDLDIKNGNQRLTGQKENVAIQQSLNSFKDNPVLSNSFLRSKGEQREFGELSDLEQFDFARTFYQEHVREKFQEVDNSIDNAKKLADLETSRRKNKEASEDVSLIRAKDEGGTPVFKASVTDRQTGKTFATGNKVSVFPLNKNYKVEDGVFASSVGRDPQGNIVLIGTKEITVDVPIKDANGNPVLESDQKTQKTKKETQTVDTFVDDKTALNVFSSRAGFGNLEEFNNELDQIEFESGTKTEVDEFGVPIEK